MAADPDRSRSETPDYTYDTFISHASADAKTAARVRETLESEGLRCWIAPRDINPGEDYGSAIIRGINDSKSLVVLLSETSMDSRHVRAEVERAVSANKTVYPVRLSDVTLSDSLKFFLSVHQWIDLFDDPTESGLKRLAGAINENMPPERLQENNRRALPWMRWALPAGIMSLAGALAVALFLTFGLDFVSQRQQKTALDRGTIIAEEQQKRYEEQATEIMTGGNISEAEALAQLERLRIYVKDLPQGGNSIAIGSNLGLVNFHAEVSMNEAPFERVSSTPIITSSPINSLRLRAVRGGEEVVAELDATSRVVGSAVEDLKTDIARLKRTYSGSFELAECHIAGCRIDRRLCAAEVSTVSLRQEGRDWARLDLSDCDADVGMCHSASALPWTPEPAAPIEMKIEFADESEMTETLPAMAEKASDKGGYFFEKPGPGAETPLAWVELAPISDSNTAPPLYASANANRFNFTPQTIAFMSGLHCPPPITDPSQHKPGRWLIDTDGFGLFEIDPVQTRNWLPSEANQLGFIAGPALAQQTDAMAAGPIEISVAKDTGDGRRLGPYSYSLDTDALLRASAGETPAKLECRRGPPAPTCFMRGPKLAGVSKVRYGDDPENLQDVTVACDAESLLTEGCELTIRAETGWRNLFYQVISADGTAQPLQRHALN